MTQASDNSELGAEMRGEKSPAVTRGGICVRHVSSLLGDAPTRLLRTCSRSSGRGSETVARRGSEAGSEAVWEMMAVRCRCIDGPSPHARIREANC